MGVYLPVCVPEHHMCAVLTEAGIGRWMPRKCSAHRDRKRMVDASEVELQIAVSHHMTCLELNPGPMEAYAFNC